MRSSSLALALVLLGTAARAEEAPACMPASLKVALDRTPGVVMMRVSKDGDNGAAVIVRWLASSGAPDMMAEDFVVRVEPTRVAIFPVRAGLICKGSAGMAYPRPAADALLTAIRLAGKDKA